MKKTCEHLNDDNERDCHNESSHVCMCCNAGVCEDHRSATCPYGGMGFIEIE